MRLYQRALLREMTATSGIALGVVSAIMLVILSVRILGTAALGEIGVSAVLPFITFGYLRFLHILLALALFIGVLLTFSRYWQDSEMVIWSGAGLSPLAWIPSVLRLSVPITLIIGTLSLALNPWLAQQRTEYENYLTVKKDEAADLTPGLFAETQRGTRVYFVESLKERGPDVRNIFIQSEDQGRTGIVVANQGSVQQMPNGDRFLVLDTGRRYEGIPGQADYRVADFLHYGFRLDPAKVKTKTAPPRERDTAYLLANPSPGNQAELAWRIGTPISALMLSLFAVPISFINPRAGRSLNILLAILLFTLYINVVSLSQSWVSHGSLGAGASLALVHGMALALLVASYWWRYGRALTRGRR
ncbi:LPS export ABC transporter permease LptF [Parasulfuritortus cantonensis]|uniref:Lipopolysaccharide export system permease protein LptF n=1 Tax=Parasulfuritortus cantonensis TaxID=2528202 RepID=A0A4R1BQI8_9PROT|nr:LPS export ABC transporter permease LptF [Parasulfuritortus cantonensis]TCJ19526.1 LPS export ABC transporter permease LptF [Parasulfuritortus cantonensis]